jgi:hypothetical protein
VACTSQAVFGDPGDGPAAQAPRRAGVSLDPVAKLDGFRGGSHAPDGGGSVKVVTQQGRVERLPTASFIKHFHNISKQNMIVRLRVAGASRRMARDRPRQPSGRRTHLRPPASPALLVDNFVEVRHRRVSF